MLSMYVTSYQRQTLDQKANEFFMLGESIKNP